jgi:hypothetical protein
MQVPLNAAAWDAHVSFNVLHLAPSPDGTHLLAATDAHRHVVYVAGTNTHARLLVCHKPPLQRLQRLHKQGPVSCACVCVFRLYCRQFTFHWKQTLWR